MGFSSVISMMSPKSRLFDQDAQLFFNAEALAFYNAVQTFNTTLGRQV